METKNLVALKFDFLHPWFVIFTNMCPCICRTRYGFFLYMPRAHLSMPDFGQAHPKNFVWWPSACATQRHETVAARRDAAYWHNT